MGLQLTNEVIRTEEDLARYRQNLEALVQERTAQLERVNTQLESEIRDRGLAEETLQLAAKEQVAGCPAGWKVSMSNGQIPERRGVILTGRLVLGK